MATIDLTTLPRELWVTALPTSGTFVAGDRLKFRNSATSYVCTTGGVAGSTAVFTQTTGTGGISGITVQDESVNVATSVTQLDFQGAGVTATVGTGEVVVTIPGGGGGSSADTWVYKTADTVINNSATLTADPHLTASLAIGTYAVDGFIHYSATTTGDVQIGWTLPTGATMVWGGQAMLSSATGTTSAIATGRISGTQTVTFGAVGIAAPVIARPIGYFTLTTAGSVTVRWAQTVAEVSDATLYTGSWLHFTKLA